MDSIKQGLPALFIAAALRWCLAHSKRKMNVRERIVERMK